MALSPQQMLRLQSKFEGLKVAESCTLVDCWFGPGVTVAHSAVVTHSAIGAAALIGTNTRIENAQIGRNCGIGDNAVIGSAAAVTRIGHNVRIGAGAHVAPGISVGDNVAIDPGRQVTSDILAATLGPPTENDPDGHLPLHEFLLEKLPIYHVVTKWHAARGDQTLRGEFPLTPESIVLDVGGYRGDWAHEILQRYGCRIHVFEPVPEFIALNQARFAGDARVTVHSFGLAGRTREEEIVLAAEGSSTLRKDPAAERQQIRLMAADEALRDIFGAARPEAAVLKINIEGGEYELLTHLLDTRLIGCFRHIQIQFHDFVPNARQLRRMLRGRLRQTHAPCWNYPFVWEAWERLPGTPGRM